jgi:hypothetical protein
LHARRDVSELGQQTDNNLFPHVEASISVGVLLAYNDMHAFYGKEKTADE